MNKNHADEIMNEMNKLLKNEITKKASDENKENKEEIKELFEALQEGKGADDKENEEYCVAADFAIEKITKMANILDEKGFYELSNVLDETMNKIAKSKYKTWKGKDEKPPKGASHKAPKEWWKKMEEELKEKNPDFSKKRISEVIGDIWDNQLSDKKREKIYKEYGKKGDPNK